MPIDDKKKKLIKEYLKETSPKELIFHEINNLNKDLTVIKDSLSKIDDFLEQLNGITDEELTEALEEVRSEFRDELSKVELKHGEDGYTPVKGVDYFDGKDGTDGKDGIDGKDGDDGYTPIKGVDYFTDEDINLISLDIQSQLKPIFDIKTSDIEDLDDFAEELKGSIEKRAIDILDQRTQFLINKKSKWDSVDGGINYSDGNVGINNTNPTALLHLGAGTATQAPLKFTQGTNLTTTEAGAMEYDGEALYFTTNDTRRSINISNGVVTSDTTVANTTTETTVFTETISPDTLHAGQKVIINMSGIYSTANASDTFTARLKIAGTTVDTFTSTAKNVSNGLFNIDFTFTVRTDGATGTLISNAIGVFDNELKSSGNTGTSSVDTTVADDVTLTIEWSSANASNTLTVQQGYAEFIH